MYPPEFTYVRADNLSEALDFLSSHENSRPLAGGQSLLPMLKLRVIQPDYVVDIGRLNELKYVRSVVEGLRIGALTTYNELLKSDQVKVLAPLLYQAVKTVGDFQVRNVGTLGGSVSQADPASDAPVALTALEAEFTLSSKGGNRVVKATEFFQGPFTTSLRSDELVTEISVPALDGYVVKYRKVVRRAGDYALASMALAVKLRGGEVEDMRLSLGGVHDRPFRAFEVEKMVIGKKLDESLAKEVAEKVSSQINPPSDHRGGPWYRREVVKLMVEKALMEVKAGVGGQ
ncbi:MAG: xanthine dehydrogenase family protein subunit M [Candidatus Aramenus sp.]|jgi:glyceraldehyde dehydrogenase medium subunit|nr:xanthine dehydrogenase family protein subunit M [Candidatus Aramenus sp.]